MSAHRYEVLKWAKTYYYKWVLYEIYANILPDASLHINLLNFHQSVGVMAAFTSYFKTRHDKFKLSSWKSQNA